MNIIEINQTTNTPSVIFNLEDGVLFISGKSFTEYPHKFYNNIISYLNDLKTQYLQIILNIDYTNTLSNKLILEMLKIFGNNKICHITWMYDENDEDMKDLGELYKQILKVDFELKAVNK